MQQLRPLDRLPGNAPGLPESVPSPVLELRGGSWDLPPRRCERDLVAGSSRSCWSCCLLSDPQRGLDIGCVSCHNARRHGLRFQNELRIAESAHLRDVQTCEFVLRANPLANYQVNHKVHRIGKTENPAQQCADADQLRDQLAGVSVEQTADRAANAVPAAAIVGSAIREQPDRNDTPYPVGAMH